MQKFLLVCFCCIFFIATGIAQEIESNLQKALHSKHLKPGLAFPWSMIPEFSSVKKPNFLPVTHTITDSTISFRFSGDDFVIKYYTKVWKEPTITVTRRDNKIFSKKFGTGYFDPEECKIRCCDLDSNGFADIFISFTYGSTGRNSSIIGIESFFFLSGSLFNHIELSSYEAYYNAFALFGDYNHDGKYEFACFSYENSDLGDLDYINLFSINNGLFTNISYNTQGFPVRFLVGSQGETKILPKIPDNYEHSLFLKRPSVIK